MWSWGERLVLLAGQNWVVPAEMLVGRRLATGALRSAVDAAGGGAGGVVLLAGEAGMGKTVLASEAVAYAKARGAAAVWGTCWEGDGAPGFWPWIQVMRALAADAGGSGEAVLAGLTGVSAERGGGLGDESAIRFRTYDLAATYLRSRAAQRPLVVVLDDLHWADVSSLRLLVFLARQLHDAAALVIGTYRDVEVTAGDHPARPLLAELAGQAELIRLTGLAADEVGQLIEKVCGEHPPAPLIQAVHDRTAGNPFFAQQIARLLAAQGVRWTGPRSPAYRPRWVTCWLVASPGCPARSWTCSPWPRSSGGGSRSRRWPPSPAYPPRWRCRSSTAPSAPRSWSTTNPAACGSATTCSAMSFTTGCRRPGGRRCTLRWPELLERHTAAAEIAYHRSVAWPLGDRDRAVTALTGAAREATARTAFDEAAAWLRRAIEVAGDATSADLVMVCEYGDALRRAGHGEEARAALAGAAARARAMGDTELLARAAFGVHRITTLTESPRSGVIALLEEALAALGADRVDGRRCGAMAAVGCAGARARRWPAS